MSRATIAAAGSGKTEFIVDAALSSPDSESVLLTTYTESNTKEIRDRIISKHGFVPANVVVMPWFTFLIRHGAKPYQNPTIGINKISGLNTEHQSVESRKKVKKEHPRNYYLDSAYRLYIDYLAEFVLLCDDVNSGAVVSRLEEIFSEIYVDEIQDISARDFEFLERLMKSRIKLTVVGDPRQGTFSTTQSKTNKAQAKAKIMVWLKKLERKKLLTLEPLDHSHRCNEIICTVADSLYPSASYPDFPRTRSLSSALTDHDGVFLVRSEHVEQYMATHSPQLLVWNSSSRRSGTRSKNMGEVKGLTYDRVLIEPTGTQEKFLKSGADLPPVSLAKLYVAITRARFSVGIILDKPGSCDLPYWHPDSSADD